MTERKRKWDQPAEGSPNTKARLEMSPTSGGADDAGAAAGACVVLFGSECLLTSEIQLPLRRGSRHNTEGAEGAQPPAVAPKVLNTKRTNVRWHARTCHLAEELTRYGVVKQLSSTTLNSLKTST